jgi:hypothetical protein
MANFNQTTTDFATRLANDEAVLLAGSNIAGDQTILGGRIAMNLLTAPQPTVTVAGTQGSTTCTYVVAAQLGTGFAPSSTATTALANATQTASNYNALAWPAVPGATGYKIWRTVGGASQGAIGVVGATQLSFNDVGVIGDGSTAPTINTTAAFTCAQLADGSIDTAFTASGIILAAAMINSFVRVTAGTATLTTDTAANIVAAIPGCQVGTTFELYLFNGSGQTATLALGTGVTAAAGVSTTLTTSTANTRCFSFRVTSVTSPAVTVYSLGQSAG